MKRISWLCLCILCACNPTPEKISINDQDRYDKLKKEAMLEAKAIHRSVCIESDIKSDECGSETLTEINAGLIKPIYQSTYGSAMNYSQARADREKRLGEVTKALSAGVEVMEPLAVILGTAMITKKIVRGGSNSKPAPKVTKTKPLVCSGVIIPSGYPRGAPVVSSVCR